MQVALDTNALYTSSAGVARYVRGLQSGLAQIASANSYHDFAWPVYNLDYQQPKRALKTIYREIIWARWPARRLLADKGIQLLHSTSGASVRPPSTIRHVVTIHDLAVIRNPSRFRRWQRYSTKQSYLNALKANRVLCISQFTADEAIELLNIPASQIDVVHNGGDFHPESCPPEQKPDFQVPSEFFLFVGSLEPGKNLQLIRQAYLLAKEQKKALPPLLIVGARWEGVPGEGAPPEGWMYLGRQPDEVLIYLYRRALALVFPSKYEGFGLPLVEAMALGCPVICSPVASLPEVAGDAALFSELTANGYCGAMRDVARGSDLRRQLISRGLVQAQKFTWKRCAQETAQVYERALH